MRGLTTRHVRPCLHHQRSCFSTPSVRRTTFPPIQRALTCADAFLFFLPSVLTAALVVDYTGKERRKAEWDRQIAIAQEEAECLKQRQLESWSRLQRRSVSHGAWQQRRSLHTQGARHIHLVGLEREEREGTEEMDQVMDPLDKREEMNASDQKTEVDADKNTEVQLVQTTDEHIQKQERFSRLIATRLALELMLRLRRARSPLYKTKPTVDTTDKTFYQSMDFIVQELEKVLGFIQVLEIQKVPWNVEMPPEYRTKQQEMAYRLLDLSERYRRAEMHLPDFIMSYVQLVTEYKIGPSNWGYVVMMRALAFKQEESRMARHVEDAILDNHELLDKYTISNVLFHHGKSMDSMRFNNFLERLTRSDHHPRPRSPWYRVNINDIDICVPWTKDGHVMTGLIRTALICRQQTVAEAYAKLFVERDMVEKYSGIHKWFVLACFLQTYGNWTSWAAGQKWLRAGLEWLVDLATADDHVAGRVVLRMLDFCVTCGKKEDYEAIMTAVVASHLPLPPVQKDKKLKISQRMGAIRLDWSNRLHALTELDPFAQTIERLEKFKSMLYGRWHSDVIPGQESPGLDIKWDGSGVKAESIAYNPFVAAQRMFAQRPEAQQLAAARLQEGSEQRHQELNPGFKRHAFEPRRIPFPESEDQRALKGKAISKTVSSSDSRSETYISPLLQTVQETDTLDEDPRNSSAPTSTSDSTPSINSNLEVAKLKEDLEATKQRLEEVEKQRNSEIEQLKRDLREARRQIRKGGRINESNDIKVHLPTG